jgi:signal recognition particle subunit SRP54
LEQLRAIKKMGSLQQVMSMIPGMNRLPENAQLDDRALVRVEAIIQSMTKQERIKPHIISGDRRKRIAAGSGSSIQEVNKILKQFGEMQKMMKRLGKGGNMRRMMKGMNMPEGL